MTDPTADFLINPSAFRQEQSLVINKDFIGRTTTPIAYDELPKRYRSHLDELAVAVMDPEGGKVIITGDPMAGKTFLIEQLAANRDVFLKRSGQKNIEFVRVTLDNARVVEMSLPRKWQAYMDTAAHVFNVESDEIVYVTESIDAAIGITALGGRVIIELSIPTFNQLMRHEGSGTIKQWASWELIDVNSLLLNKNDTISIMASALLDKLNTTYPEISMTKDHIRKFVNYAVKHGELTIDTDLDEAHVGLLMAQPGIFARAISRLASILAMSSDARDSKGNVSVNKAIVKTFSDFEDVFFSCLQGIIERSESNESQFNEDNIEDSIRALIEENIPGARVTTIQGTRSREPQKESKHDWKFSDFKTLNKRLSERVLGQSTAVDQVVNGLKIPAAGLNLESKPLRSLLFLGPTGVGKTELALSLAKELMDSELPVKRIDMSEFGQEHEASKLLGAPPGYTGHEEGGVLTNFVGANPYSLVILDEIEKAHPKIWDSFLQILDAGRMTDGKGQTVDFSNTIIIMTSNIGADKLSKPNAGFLSVSESELYEARKSHAESIVTKEVERTFKPELINRLDQLVIFNELPREVLRGVIAKEISLVTGRLTNQGYTLDTPKSDILDHIASMADASKYGAREVQRVIGKNVYGLLADKVLEGQEKKGLKLALKDGNLTVRQRKIGTPDDK